MNVLNRNILFLGLLFYFLTSFGLTYAQLLTDSVWQLNEVEVVAHKQKKAIQGLLSGKLELQMEELNSLPKFLGVVDPLRTMQLMPGVQTAGELNSGIYIRGGEPSHNLVLLNGAPLYNAMHLMGFFSVFNGNHLGKSVLLKSSISPEYGGRAAGVLEMTSLDSVSHKPILKGNIGLISSQATVGLPLTSRGTLYLSGRGTYVNPMINLLENSTDKMSFDYGFQDFNLTYVYQPSARHKIILNGYYGRDRLSVKEHFYQVAGGIFWQNIASSLRWQSSFARNRQMEHTFYFSSYKNKIDMVQNEIKICFPSDITDIGYRGKFDFDFLRSRWTVGADYAYHFTHPQYPHIEEMFGAGSATISPGLYRTQEAAVYMRCRTFWGTRFITDFGLRYSGWLQMGAYKESAYDALGNEIPFFSYKRGEFVCFYGGIEPRLSAEYRIDANRKLIFSYGLQRQYMNQVAVSNIGFPTDFWMPASKRVLPQSAHSFSGGYYHSLKEDAYEFSIEAYYKRLSNQLEFNGELLDMVNQHYVIEERLLRGSGYTYGVEGMIKKNSGKFTGWISYTLGWAWRKFPDINGGKAFPSKHDRRHDLSVVACYELNNRWDFSAVFVYATGNAFTMPEAFYLIGENAVNQYGPYNGARMPAYHRLDLSANYWLKKNAKRESGFNFSLYNAYARENPVYLGVSVRANKEKKKVKFIRKGTYLYSLLPSVSYTFKF